MANYCNDTIEDIKQYLEIIHPSDWYLKRKLNELKKQLKTDRDILSKY